MPRPRFQPSEDQRQFVKSLAAFGVLQEQIARRLGIRSLKTLRRHFRKELDWGALEANLNVTKTLYKMATSGEHPGASMFWMKSRCGWNDRPNFNPFPGPPPPFIVGKEEGGPNHDPA